MNKEIYKAAKKSEKEKKKKRKLQNSFFSSSLLLGRCLSSCLPNSAKLSSKSSFLHFNIFFSATLRVMVFIIWLDKNESSLLCQHTGFTIVWLSSKSTSRIFFAFLALFSALLAHDRYENFRSTSKVIVHGFKLLTRWKWKFFAFSTLMGNISQLRDSLVETARERICAGWVVTVFSSIHRTTSSWWLRVAAHIP